MPESNMQPSDIMLPEFGVVIPREQFAGAFSTVALRRSWKLLPPESADQPWKIQEIPKLTLRYYVCLGSPMEDTEEKELQGPPSRWEQLWKDGELELARETVDLPARSEEILTESRDFLGILTPRQREILGHEIQFLSNHMRVKARYEEEAIAFSQKQQQSLQEGKDFTENQPIAPRDDDFKARLARLAVNISNIHADSPEQLTPHYLQGLNPESDETKEIISHITIYSAGHLKPLINGAA